MSLDIVSIASVASAVKSAVSNVSCTSAGGGSATGLQAVIDALSNRMSGITGGTGSVTSAEATASVRAFSAAGSANTSVKGFLQSVVNRISNTFSNAFSAGSVISADIASVKSVISVKAPWNAAQYAIVSDTQSTNGSALVDMSGMVLTVAAGETWRIMVMGNHSTSATNAGFKLGLSVPPLSTPRFYTANFTTGSQSAVAPGAAGLMQVSGSSTLLSITSNAAGAVNSFTLDALFNVASAGTVRVMFAGMASTAQSPAQILAGTHMIAFRLK